MKLDSFIAVLLALALAGAALAQHRGSGSGAGEAYKTGHAGPYAGFDKRQVASLFDEDVAALEAGRGMGFALPAELNGYPGPMHILELAEPLKLSAEQRAKVQSIFERMLTRAKEAGGRYVEAEKSLDAAFRSGHAETEMVRRLALEADRLRSEKRLAHLEAHLEVAPVLTGEQKREYARLRGYAAR